jgi:glycosyltransferase involved in cell wall biosynthesis
VNICFASLNYPTNGGATSGVGAQVQLLAHSLIALGHSVSVIDLATNGKNSTVEDRGVTVHRMRSGSLHWFAGKLPFIGNIVALPIREIEYSFAVLRGIRQAERSHQLDLIEGTETGALLLSLFRKAVPLVIRLHGERYTFTKHTPGLRVTLDVRISRALQRFALRRAVLLVSPSRAHAQEIARELHSDHTSSRVIPNCIDLEELPSSEVSREQNLVLFVGRLERVKGVSLLLEAARMVVQECPNTRFVLAGASHPTMPAEEIDAIIRSYSLEEHFERLNFVPRQKLISLYQRAAICVVPSHYESFGLVALEAMACGLPVVATRVGGLPEVVKDKVTGLLVPPNAPAALAKAICELLTDPSKRTSMGKAGYERARAKFSVEHHAIVNECLYEEILARLNTTARDNAISGQLA